jgi:hypothetical protein
MIEKPPAPGSGVSVKGARHGRSILHLRSASEAERH